MLFICLLVFQVVHACKDVGGCGDSAIPYDKAVAGLGKQVRLHEGLPRQTCGSCQQLHIIGLNTVLPYRQTCFITTRHVQDAGRMQLVTLVAFGRI